MVLSYHGWRHLVIRQLIPGILLALIVLLGLVRVSLAANHARASFGDGNGVFSFAAGPDPEEVQAVDKICFYNLIDGQSSLLFCVFAPCDCCEQVFKGSVEIPFDESKIGSRVKARAWNAEGFSEPSGMEYHLIWVSEPPMRVGMMAGLAALAYMNLAQQAPRD